MSASSELALQILEQMLADLPSQEAIYHPTHFWSQASTPIVDELRAHGFDRFRSLDGARLFFVPTYGAPGGAYSEGEFEQLMALVGTMDRPGGKKYQSLLHILSGELWALADYRVMLAGSMGRNGLRLSEFSESDVGEPMERFHFDGRAYSRSALNYLNGLCFLQQQIGDEIGSIRNVLEIGGGFGTLGEILSQMGQYTYIDVDIPPTAAVSSFYLKQQAGIEFIDYLQTRAQDVIKVPAPEASASRQMVLCPWQLPRLQGKIDLFVNFISFQEMELEVVRNYLAEVDRLGARFVLLRNLREGKAVKSEQVPYGVERPLLGSDYDTLLPGYELQATNVYPFGYRTIDGYHSELRLYRRRG
jgi:putative sugar O-methyltransferase